MHFALLGDHPDGLDMARALSESGRHELTVYCGPAVGAEFLRRWGLSFRASHDPEEALADPRVEAVIVAGNLDARPEQLRRALQSEHHVLCVHPADHRPDIAYEAAMIQADTRCLLMPLLPEALHPGIARFAEIANDDSILGAGRLIELERGSPDAVLIEDHSATRKPALPGWDILRVVGGEIGEVSGFATGEHLTSDRAALFAGSFEKGGLFRAALLPGQHETYLRLAAIGSYARAELSFPKGWPAPAQLHWHDDTGAARSESWESWNPWLGVVEAFESALAKHAGAAAQETQATQGVRLNGTLTWQDEIRALELDDAARRSVERRRVSVLEYPEASEAVGFKGTMTLVGCGIVWAMLLLLVLAAWFPWLLWVIGLLLVFFLGLQILRWLVPAPEQAEVDRRTPE